MSSGVASDPKDSKPFVGGKVFFKDSIEISIKKKENRDSYLSENSNDSRRPALYSSEGGIKDKTYFESKFKFETHVM